MLGLVAGKIQLLQELLGKTDATESELFKQARPELEATLLVLSTNAQINCYNSRMEKRVY